MYIDTPLSDEYLVLSAAGEVLERSMNIATALAAGRARAPAAVAVIGAPSGVVLARVCHGIATPEQPAARAAARWKAAQAARAKAEAAEAERTKAEQSAERKRRQEQRAAATEPPVTSSEASQPPPPSATVAA
jgi:hypothetical protein